MPRQDLLLRYITTNQAIFRTWKQRFFDEVAESNLSPAQIGILFTVYRSQPIASVAIAKELRITRGAVAQIIESLDQIGYISKEIDETDRRIVKISLTKTGNKKVKNMELVRQNFAQEITSVLDDSELEQALRINEKILKQLEK